MAEADVWLEDAGDWAAKDLQVRGSSTSLDSHESGDSLCSGKTDDVSQHK